MSEIQIKHPYLMFLGDARDQLAAKTADGIAFWRHDWCVGQLRLPGCNADIGLPDMSIADAAARGAQTLVIGVANAGGVLTESWTDTIVEALESGLDVASGLHMRVAEVPIVKETADRLGRLLFDVRHPTQEFATGKGTARTGKRLLTVGTDCSIGKMYTCLAMEQDMHSRGMKADFRATGQTGIFIAGTGVSVDAVVGDFISGSVEWLAPDNDPDHWDLIEGQGSLFHASYAGVTLGLIHGSQPDALVMCHEPTRTSMRGLPESPLPPVDVCIRANVEAAQLTNPDCRVIGVAVNTSALENEDAIKYLADLEKETGLPCVDPVRHGVSRLVDALP
jgi:uncharacterized NAD-dependent epimerase/dehydratase family protein